VSLFTLELKWPFGIQSGVFSVPSLEKRRSSLGALARPLLGRSSGLSGDHFPVLLSQKYHPRHMSFLRRIIYVAVGGLTFGTGVYAAASFFGPKTPEAQIVYNPAVGAVIPREQSRQVHDHLAPKYDSLVATDEVVTGVNTMRAKLGSTAKGKVLEIAVGSGRNFSYYGDLVTHITAMDYSSAMMKQAMTKANSKPTRFIEGDAHNLSSLVEEQFDTVVDSFGLCSFEDPVHVLKEMQKVCKPTGQILLLEHGASDSRWLRIYMDRKAHSHATSWACFFNRDIESLVEQAGLHIVHKEKRHFGTTHFIIATPSAPNSVGTPETPLDSSLPADQSDSGKQSRLSKIKSKAEDLKAKVLQK
jgi:methyltransferase OMS1